MCKYSLMDEAVEKLCKSLREEPKMWVFKALDFYHRDSPSVQYWHHYYYITLISSGCITEQVFSTKQGQIIRDAVDFARNVQASEAQKRIIESLNRVDLAKEVVVTGTLVEVLNKQSVWKTIKGVFTRG